MFSLEWAVWSSSCLQTLLVRTGLFFLHYHVGLPGSRTDASVDAPPEIIFWFSSPCEHWNTWTGVRDEQKDEVMTKPGFKNWIKKPQQMVILYLLQPEQQPQSSGWRRCYKLPSDTEPPGHTGFLSVPAKHHLSTMSPKLLPDCNALQITYVICIVLNFLILNMMMDSSALMF